MVSCYFENNFNFLKTEMRHKTLFCSIFKIMCPAYRLTYHLLECDNLGELLEIEDGPDGDYFMTGTNLSFFNEENKSDRETTRIADSFAYYYYKKNLLEELKYNVKSFSDDSKTTIMFLGTDDQMESVLKREFNHNINGQELEEGEKSIGAMIYDRDQHDLMVVKEVQLN